MNNKVLVIDDEPDVLDLVSLHLTKAGLIVIRAADGPSGLELASAERPGLIVLDLLLPQTSGLEVFKALKSNSETANIPVIMLTAKAAEVDRIVGLEMGADDYVTKPFSPRELVLRAKSVLRGSSRQQEASDHANCGDIRIDRMRYQVTVKGRPVELTAKEFKLLSLLVARRGRVQSREKLLHEVWGYDAAIDTRTVDTHIHRLREKLGTAGACIETVRGTGYTLVAERSDPAPSPTPSRPCAASAA